MTVASAASGSQAATLDTEHNLSTQTDAGVYVLVVDCNAMVDGDITIIRIKTKDKSAGTSRLAYIDTLAHTQGAPHYYSVPVPVDTEIICTLEQTDGTGRTYDWNLLKIS